MSGSDDGFIYIWDRHSEGIVQWLCGDLTFAVSAIEPHPHYPMMATCGCDNSVKVRITRANAAFLVVYFTIFEWEQ